MAATRVFGACSRALMAAAAKGAASGVKTAAKTATPKGRGSALTKIIPVSPQLGKFLGASESSRTDAVKKVWGHIKLHNLQKSVELFGKHTEMFYITFLDECFKSFKAFRSLAILKDLVSESSEKPLR